MSLFTKHFLLAGCFLALCLVHATSHAKEDAPIGGQLKGNGTYGVAGCGLGSMVFGAQPGMIQVLAATTNGTSGTQTFGISSGTSNCDVPGTRNGKQASAVPYIEANQMALSNDISRGEGATLNQLTRFYGHPLTPKMGKLLQQHYADIFPTLHVKADHVEDTLKTLLAKQ